MDSHRLIKTGGGLLVALSLFYIGASLWEHRQTLAHWQPDGPTVVMVILGVAIYAGGGLLLSTAWRYLLVWCGQEGADFGRCHGVYGRTQIAKYLPGNIFHLAGRHVAGREAGFGHVALVGASAYEILGVLVASAMIGLGGMVLFKTGNGSLEPVQVVALLGIVVTLAGAAALVAPRLARHRGVDLPLLERSRLLGGALPALGLYLAFFLINGLILTGLVHTASGLTGLQQGVQVVTLFSLCWMAGFITPGAPAGVGIREALIVLSLTPLVGESQGLIIALGYRLISVLGDVVFFLLALFLFSPSRHRPAPSVPGA